MMGIKKRIGFTLVELMVVISIIGILTGLIITVLNPKKFKGQARDAVRLQDLAIVKGALEQYYAENNTYPSSMSFGTAWNPYLKAVPNDPRNSSDGWGYCYSKVNSQNYVLCANIEDSRNNTSLPNQCTPPGSTGGDVAGIYCIENPF